MLEVLQYVTSSFWVFIGSVIFTVAVSHSIGWGVYLMLLGLRGKILKRG